MAPPETMNRPLVIESHVMHPGHTLYLVDFNTHFECDGCYGPGHGRRYRCSTCTGEHPFSLHERCATCPSSLSCGFHPGHPLTLTVSHDSPRPCALCGEDVVGLYYMCSRGPSTGCTFNIHPLCTELPSSVHHALHPHHPLTLQPSSSAGCCLACGRLCPDRWRYRCSLCGVDAHLECAFGQVPPSPPRVAVSHPAVGATRRPFRPAPPPPHPATLSYQNGYYYVVPAGVPNTFAACSYHNHRPLTYYPHGQTGNCYYPQWQARNCYYPQWQARNCYYPQWQAGNYNYRQYGQYSTTSSGNNGLITRARISSLLRSIALHLAVGALTGGLF